MSDRDPQTVGQTDTDTEQNVDKIREIIFGGQMRDYQRRFDAMESSITDMTERLRHDMSARMDGIEAFVRREIELLGERLVNERRERNEEREQLNADLVESRRRLEESLNRIDEQYANEARSIRAALQEKGAELAQLIQGSRDDFNATLTRQANSLEERKISRDDLAGMLSEVAMRLNRELDLPSE
ncbi:MAG: hypothetical protein HKN49_13515 [Gammaproteobacteria bacterium]|nr:hypothetical protein [Gammaproteobacteria bacterium]